MAEANESYNDNEGVLSEELGVLESIYITELAVEKADNGWPRAVSVLLHPATGMDEDKKYVCMTLIFTIPHTYPDEVPDINVRNPRGLGEEELHSLIEDMKKLAEESKGGAMLFELIEMAKDCLTEGNVPHCECAICLDHFEEGDAFVKTDCYHYFHRLCLARYAAAFIYKMQAEEEPIVRHASGKEDEKTLGCPMCRLPLTCDLSELLSEPIPPEELIHFTPPAELLQQQAAMAERYKEQKARGAIIDLEAERNKFLVSEDTVVSLENIRKTQQSSAAESSDVSSLSSQYYKGRKRHGAHSPRDKREHVGGGRGRNPRYQRDRDNAHYSHHDVRSQCYHDRTDTIHDSSARSDRWHNNRDGPQDGGRRQAGKRGPQRENHRQEKDWRDRNHRRGDNKSQAASSHPNNKSARAEKDVANHVPISRTIGNDDKCVPANATGENGMKGNIKNFAQDATMHNGNTENQEPADGNRHDNTPAEHSKHETGPLKTSDAQKDNKSEEHTRNERSGDTSEVNSHINETFHSDYHCTKMSSHAKSEKDDEHKENQHTDNKDGLKGQRYECGSRIDEKDHAHFNKQEKCIGQSGSKGNWAHEWSQRKRHEQHSHRHQHGLRRDQWRHDPSNHIQNQDEKTRTRKPESEDWDAEIEREKKTEEKTGRIEKPDVGKSHTDRHRKDSHKKSVGIANVHETEDQEAEARIARQALSTISHFIDGPKRGSGHKRQPGTGHRDSATSARLRTDNNCVSQEQEDWEPEIQTARKELESASQRPPRSDHLYHDRDADNASAASRRDTRSKRSPQKGLKSAENFHHKISGHKNNHGAPPGFKTRPPPGFGKKSDGLSAKNDGFYTKSDRSVMKPAAENPTKVRPPPGFEFT